MKSKETSLPLVSIVIPTYNNATYIADALKSAISQDYSNLEIIVLDDASNDNTAEIVNPYTTDPRVRYFKNDQNIGRVANYHKGLYDLARGEWYLNLDGDDLISPRHHRRCGRLQTAAASAGWAPGRSSKCRRSA